MKACTFPKRWLSAWLDSEAGEQNDAVEKHLVTCRECAQEVEDLRRTSAAVRTLLDNAVGEVEPLLALQKIRARIRDNAERAFMARLRAWWSDVWLFHRRALAGVTAAVALGALSAPIVTYWTGMVEGAPADGGPQTASVVVESLEVGGNATTVVLRGNGDSATLIWVVSSEDRNAEESF
ncbi:MAG: hypothetical protein HYZ27_00530 [Deltaproteobacteria bacterium]|nr:hypothetical protein [Deltaproteobacteria bacterium]